MAMVLVGLFLGSVALAQQTTVMNGTTGIIFNDPIAVARGYCCQQQRWCWAQVC
jgi:hypothetical protein